MTGTHTLATMDLSPDAYAEIRREIVKAQQEERFVYDGQLENGVDMNGIMVTPYGELTAKLEAAVAAEMTVARAKRTEMVDVPEGYDSLAGVLVMALEQAASGKGKERHARPDVPFERQPICELPRMVGPAGTAYQVMKKTQEAMRMDADRAVAELLGAINYAAATILVIRENEQQRMGDNVTEDNGDDGEPIPAFLTRRDNGGSK